MGDPPPPLHPLPRIVAPCLARGLEALVARTDARRRVVHRPGSRWCERSPVVEEPRSGGPGRRDPVSVDRCPDPAALLVARR